jgi:hypothetical protein
VSDHPIIVAYGGGRKDGGLKVTLNSYEVGGGVRVGGSRHYHALKANKPDCHGFDGDGWGAHIEGALGEQAVAKALNIYWDGSVNTWKAEDLAGIQVRTRREHWHDLIVRPDDSDASAWVLVTGKEGDYIVRGWIAGGEAKRQEWLKDHGQRPKAYFVPQSALRPLAELKRKKAA